MKGLAFLCVTIACLFAGVAAQRHSTMRPYQTAVGVLEKSSGGRAVINWNPCGDAKFLTIDGNFRIKNLGVKRCNNGKTYEAVQITQCGGDRDQRHAICKSAN